MKYKIVCIALLLIISQSVFSQNENLTKEVYRKVDSLFRSYNQNDKTGSAIAIIKNEKMVYKNYLGLANIEYQQPITDSAVFNIASVSKQFTTYLALLLEEEGKLAFDDDIRQYLPELANLPHKITIKQLTNHTHGLPNTDELAQLKGVELMNHQEVLKMLLNIKQVSFLPGDNYFYNNTGYVLLSEIIERVGQKPFKEQLEDRIFKPLGMNHTQAVGYTNEVIKNKAYSYKLWGETYISQPVKGATMGSSGIYSSINDLSLWAKNYQKVTVGKRKFYEKMELTTFLNSEKKINYGLGLQFANYKGVDVVFHGGGTESYRSYILHAPEHQLLLVFLSNKGDFSGLEIMYGSLEILLPEFIKEKSITGTNWNKRQLKGFEGTYQVFPGTYYTFMAEEDELYFQEFGSSEKVVLPRIDQNIFRFPFIPHSKFEFYKDSLDFHIADFTYPAKKIKINLPKTEDLNLKEFIGTYRNTEYNTTYELVLVDDTLTAIHGTINYPIVLYPIAKNSFYSNQSFFGKIDFILNSENSIIGFKLSGQNLKNIIFKKLI